MKWLKQLFKGFGGLPADDGAKPTNDFQVKSDTTHSVTQANRIGNVTHHHHYAGPGAPEDQWQPRFGDAEIRQYCEKVESLYGTIPLAGFRTKLRVPIRVEEIYVPLRAMMNLQRTGNACFISGEEADKCLRESGEGSEISLPEAFVETERRRWRGVVILGDPGSGKTTHLKRVLLWCLRGEWRKMGLPENMLPVFLPLRELKDLDQGIDRFIEAQFDSPHLNMPEGFGRRMLDRGNLLFLFDGLDEVTEPDHRKEVARWIEAALIGHGTCRFVVTCRFAGYTADAHLNEQFLEMHLRPLDEHQAENFIRNWYAIVEGGLSDDPDQADVTATQKSDELIERLRRPEFRARRVFELTRNPLLLTNICLIHRDRGGSLPHTRARLYGECTEVLLELWRGAAKVPTRVKAEDGQRVLQPVALWMHQEKNRIRATAVELMPVIEPALKAVNWPHGTAEDFLKAVRDESGLLTGWDQAHFGFMHLGFQEYLAAHEIRNQVLHTWDKTLLEKLADQFGKSWWEEVTLLLVALGRPCLFERFMREVVHRPAFAAHSSLVDACLEEAAETSSAPFLELISTHPEKDVDDLWARQRLALRILERLDASALEPLLPALKAHPDEKIRRWLAERSKATAKEFVAADRGGAELVRIPAGAFKRGSYWVEKGRDDDESPKHEVAVPEFYMGRYPVNNEEYGRFLAKNSGMPEPKFWADRRFNQERQPVVGVSWEDARRYAKWAGLRLPSEAEWEYACRAGTTNRYYTGDTEADLDRAGWYAGNSGGELHPVGEKEPNAFGLYDMHGNVREWCEDDWHDSYTVAPADGGAWVDKPNRGSRRVLRGGSWGSSARCCRAAFRGRVSPDGRNDDLGFRLSRS